MNINIKHLLLVGIIIYFLDFIYLYINQSWYKNEIFRSQGSELQIKWSGVFLRYFAQTLGLYLFVLSNNYSILYAFLYGLIIYSNYIGTNYATINIFDPKLAIIDLIKGGCIMSITAYIYYKLI